MQYANIKVFFITLLNSQLSFWIVDFVGNLQCKSGGTLQLDNTFI